MTDVFFDKLKEISDKHIRLFPLANLMGQIAHFSSEYNEMKEAYRDYNRTKDEWDYAHYIEECADVFIVIAGIYRFNNELAEVLLSGLRVLIECIPIKVFMRQVDKKWAKNESRNWNYVGNGDYKHQKKDKISK